MRTGAPWRDLLPNYGNWSNKPDDEWLMIDASIARFILMPVAQEAAIKR